MSDEYSILHIKHIKLYIYSVYTRETFSSPRCQLHSSLIKWMLFQWCFQSFLTLVTLSSFALSKPHCFGDKQNSILEIWICWNNLCLFASSVYCEIELLFLAVSWELEKKQSICLLEYFFNYFLWYIYICNNYLLIMPAVWGTSYLLSAYCWAWVLSLYQRNFTFLLLFVLGQR